MSIEAITYLLETIAQLFPISQRHRKTLSPSLFTVPLSVFTYTYNPVYFSQCARPLHSRSDQHIICCACPRQRHLPSVWNISKHRNRRCTNDSILWRHHSSRKIRDHPAARQRTWIHVDLRTRSLR